MSVTTPAARAALRALVASWTPAEQRDAFSARGVAPARVAALGWVPSRAAVRRAVAQGVPDPEDAVVAACMGRHDLAGALARNDALTPDAAWRIVDQAADVVCRGLSRTRQRAVALASAVLAHHRPTLDHPRVGPLVARALQEHEGEARASSMLTPEIRRRLAQCDASWGEHAITRVLCAHPDLPPATLGVLLDATLRRNAAAAEPAGAMLRPISVYQALLGHPHADAELWLRALPHADGSTAIFAPLVARPAAMAMPALRTVIHASHAMEVLVARAAHEAPADAVGALRTLERDNRLAGLFAQRAFMHRRDITEEMLAVFLTSRNANARAEAVRRLVPRARAAAARTRRRRRTA